MILLPPIFLATRGAPGDAELVVRLQRRDPQALAERLQFLLNAPEMVVHMGKMARKRVEREFTWSIVAMRTAALYDSVLAERLHETLPIDIGIIPTASLTQAPKHPEINS